MPVCCHTVTHVVNSLMLRRSYCHTIRPTLLHSQTCGEIATLFYLRCHIVAWLHCYTYSHTIGNTVTLLHFYRVTLSHCHMTTLSHSYAVRWSLSHGYTVTLWWHSYTCSDTVILLHFLTDYTVTPVAIVIQVTLSYKDTVTHVVTQSHCYTSTQITLSYSDTVTHVVTVIQLTLSHSATVTHTVTQSYYHPDFHTNQPWNWQRNTEVSFHSYR